MEDDPPATGQPIRHLTGKPKLTGRGRKEALDNIVNINDGHET